MDIEYKIGIGVAVLILIAVIIVIRGDGMKEHCAKAKCPEGTHSILVRSQYNADCVCAPDVYEE